jgi:hypothetical protein
VSLCSWMSTTKSPSQICYCPFFRSPFGNLYVLLYARVVFFSRYSFLGDLSVLLYARMIVVVELWALSVQVDIEVVISITC